MRLTATLLLLAALVLAPVMPARSYTLQFTGTNAATQVKWTTKTILVALSSSLTAPQTYIKPGSDVVGAARRALARWSQAADIEFAIVGSSPNQTMAQDGVSLITVAPENSPQFSSNVQPGRARVFFDASGGIFEADLAINPNIARRDPFTGGLVSSFFSTDGTNGSYDLESTFVHEIGHMLGLEHSAVLAASMQPRQGVNGTFDLPAQAVRTLSSDDVAGLRSIYGPRSGLGRIEGTVSYVGGAAAFGAHVWAEDIATGRVVAGNIALPNGFYRIESLPPGQYRVIAEYLDEPVAANQIASRSGAYQGLSSTNTVPFSTTEAGTANVTADAATPFSFNVQGGVVAFNPTFIGTASSGMLSTTPVPLVPGQRTTVLVGGDNIGSVNAVTANSPFITVANLQDIPGFGIPVLSFDVNLSVVTPPGDYSLRLQSGTGQISYISGGLTIDLPNGTASAGANLIDNAQFFVAQHYRDFLSREPDAGGLSFWTNEIASCGSNTQCIADKRVNVSAAFFLSIEFKETGYFVYRIYKAAFGDLPNRPVPVRMQQFFPDTQRIGRGVVVGVGNWPAQLEANKQAFALELVSRPEFLARYPAGMSPAQFVNALDANAGGVLSSDERAALVNELLANNTNAGRASVLGKVAEDADLVAAEFNKAFVLMQYFGYMRRNPDDAPDTNFGGFNFWLSKLNEFNGNFVQAQMVQAFITSFEYRERFGPR
ncbi:MAG: matrixin family metalloprotease [Acidobacteria bacterium]|nr:matrixin family metalloprotease [Acidobacteriota bacterium]